jgi:hypothetical protein
MKFLRARKKEKKESNNKKDTSSKPYGDNSSSQVPK